VTRNKVGAWTSPWQQQTARLAVRCTRSIGENRTRRGQAPWPQTTQLLPVLLTTSTKSCWQRKENAKKGKGEAHLIVGRGDKLRVTGEPACPEDGPRATVWQQHFFRSTRCKTERRHPGSAKRQWFCERGHDPTPSRITVETQYAPWTQPIAPASLENWDRAEPWVVGDTYGQHGLL
jgi:hypothetical protein